ncbi:ABC transporter substrate-binding protein [Nonomuraea jabiensis]|uniref:ABC transporter substrate-binding protein n=1 Tax=Nonomuraea jabiensis TaxID=882448 RepID=UPI0036884CDE
MKLEFWNPFTGPDGAYFKTMVEKFEKANPNIDINMTTLQAADLYSKLPTAVASGKGPDVAVIHLDSVATIAAQGNLLSLDAVVKNLGFTQDDFAPAVWQGGVWKGARYSIPLDMHMLGLFYNKTVLKQAGLDPDKPPQTAQDYLAALEKLKKAGIAGQWIDSYGFMRTLFVSLLKQFGGEQLNDTGDKALWNSEAGVRALTWMQDLIKKGYSPKNVGTDAYWGAFKGNKTAFVWGGIWALGDPDLKNVDWDVAPLPVIGDQPGVWSNSHQFVATRQIKGDANKTAAAAYFINKISADSIEWARANQVPARASVRKSGEFAELKKVATFATQIDALSLPDTFPGLNDINLALEKEINTVLLLKSEPKEALDRAVQKANAILADNKAKYGY